MALIAFMRWCAVKQPIEQTPDNVARVRHILK